MSLPKKFHLRSKKADAEAEPTPVDNDPIMEERDAEESLDAPHEDAKDTVEENEDREVDERRGTRHQKMMKILSRPITRKLINKSKSTLHFPQWRRETKRPLLKKMMLPRQRRKQLLNLQPTMKR